MRGMNVYCRDGRKLRFFYHAECFSGNEDPRTQNGSSYHENESYHKKLAPKVSALEVHIYAIFYHCNEYIYII